MVQIGEGGLGAVSGRCVNQPVVLPRQRNYAGQLVRNGDRFADKASGSDGGIVIHCHTGINPGPQAVYAVLLTRGDPVEAFDLIRTARPVVWEGYAEDARVGSHRTRYGGRLPQRSATAPVGWPVDAGHPHDTIPIFRRCIRPTSHGSSSPPQTHP